MGPTSRQARRIALRGVAWEIGVSTEGGNDGAEPDAKTRTQRRTQTGAKPERD